MSRETEERNIKYVRDLFAATGGGDWKTAESMLTADFLVTEADTLPFAGVYRGPGALQKLFEIVMASAGVVGLDIHEITAGGDRVVALLDLLLEGTPPLRVSLAETFRFRDGKVCEIRPYYYDQTPIVSAVAARKKAAGKA
jgi:ketosteroid isomerase-like protein